MSYSAAKPNGETEGGGKEASMRWMQVRARVSGIRDTLAHGLSALGASASGAPAWALHNLNELSPLALPLLTSPLVGEGAAFACTRQLAGCLPGPLRRYAADVASALRVTRLMEQASQG